MKALAQADEGIRLDGVQQPSRLVAGEDRSFSFRRRIARPADGGSRIDLDDPARHQVVEEML